TLSALSRPPCVSPATRSGSHELNATDRPSGVIAGEVLVLPNPEGVGATLMPSVVAATRSRTNTSDAPSLSPGTRVSAADANATKRPSALIDATSLLSSACAPALLRLTRCGAAVPPARSTTNTSLVKLVSPGTRLSAKELNATKRPSGVIAGFELSLFASVLPPDMLSRSVVPAPPVADDHVRHVVPIALDEVRRGRDEGHVPAVRAQRRPTEVAVQDATRLAHPCLPRGAFPAGP